MGRGRVGFGNGRVFGHGLGRPLSEQNLGDCAYTYSSREIDTQDSTRLVVLTYRSSSCS